MKKHFYIVIIIALLLCTFVATRVTYMNQDELAWIDVYEEGDTVFFASDLNNHDTLVVKEKRISNSLEPFHANIFDIYCELTAWARIEYTIYHKGEPKDCYFQIDKTENIRPVLVSSLFYKFSLSTTELNLNIVKMQVNNVNYDDCLYFDSSNSNISPKGEIESMVWSKSKGLLKYTLKTGESYTRKS